MRKIEHKQKYKRNAVAGRQKKQILLEFLKNRGKKVLFFAEIILANQLF